MQTPVVICDKCGGATRLITRVRPVGSNMPGARIYECTVCQHHSWRDWTHPPTPAPRPDTIVQQQEQTQTDKEEENKKEDDKGEK